MSVLTAGLADTPTAELEQELAGVRAEIDRMGSAIVVDPEKFRVRQLELVAWRDVLAGELDRRAPEALPGAGVV